MSGVPRGRLTPEAKQALSATIRELRARLLRDLSDEAERRYRLSATIAQAGLAEAPRRRRERLEAWLDERVRASGAKTQKEKEAAWKRFLDQAVKEAAATLLNRLVLVRHMEALGLAKPVVVTGGWNSPGYRDFREFAPGLIGDDTEGYATLLQLIFDELALELPGLFGDVGLVRLFHVPPATLREVVSRLDDDALASAWTDDTTLGWVYQYWNDPEREALDAKINAGGKIEPHEIASKTQMFTERYMVEWLLQNSLGLVWLQICRRNGWTPDAEKVLPGLEQRRAEWRKKREAGEVALDALMPIEGELEEAWKYYVPQPLPADSEGGTGRNEGTGGGKEPEGETRRKGGKGGGKGKGSDPGAVYGETLAPSSPRPAKRGEGEARSAEGEGQPLSIRDVRLLDPACGSGHFLCSAFDLLVLMYHEEARHRGETWSDKEIAESILTRNLHGIDIDPRAVQIAAAGLFLKAKSLARDARPGHLNLVAPTLQLGKLADDDPALAQLRRELKDEAGIPEDLTRRLVGSLAGVDYLGSLLKVDAAVDEALAAANLEIERGLPGQGDLWQGFATEKVTLTSGQARATVLDKLERFLAHHSGSQDLGLRLDGEQLAAGVRFVRLVRECSYDVVVGNPPYQGLSKTDKLGYVAQKYPRGKADLYAAFLERGLELAKEGGLSALLTMRGWMFLGQFEALRKPVLHQCDLRLLGDVDRGAFEDVPDEVLATTMSVIRRSAPDALAIATQPTALDDHSRDSGRTARKRAALLAQVGRYEFDPKGFEVIEGEPIVYWWSREFLGWYAATAKLGSVAQVRLGLSTGDNVRFSRRPWEVNPGFLSSLSLGSFRYNTCGWAPFIKGAEGANWWEPLSVLVRWADAGLEIQVNPRAAMRNPGINFRRGVAFTPIGNTFGARLHRFESVIDATGRSVFGAAPETVVLSMNTGIARDIAQAFNPSVSFTVGDVVRLPFTAVPDERGILEAIDRAFTEHEAARETSVEFKRPGPSPWRYAQDWAQRAVDRPEGAPLPAYEPVYDPPEPASFVSFALGVVLGRFAARGEGILDQAPATAMPHGILFLGQEGRDGLDHPACAGLHAAWDAHGTVVGEGDDLRTYLQRSFFDWHRRLYENRPIYFPLSSAKKSYVALVSIHRFMPKWGDSDRKWGDGSRWGDCALQVLLAEYLVPEQRRLLGEIEDIQKARAEADKRGKAERRFAEVRKLLDELSDFIAKVTEIAEHGPPPPDDKTPPRECDARFVMDLDDGVMVNSAALWPLLEPQWKDPKKWWKELATAQGRKDYDWSHLAARYFPKRVRAKCVDDPSLAVAHKCFWELHPAKAYAWELRLQDEIRPDFTIDEPGSDEYRRRFLADRPDEAAAAQAKEAQRRARKSKSDEDDAPLLHRAGDDTDEEATDA